MTNLLWKQSVNPARFTPEVLLWVWPCPLSDSWLFSWLCPSVSVVVVVGSSSSAAAASSSSCAYRERYYKLRYFSPQSSVLPVPEVAEEEEENPGRWMA